MRRYWTCRKCSTRNERTASRRCTGCGESTKPKARKPKHAHALEKPFDVFAELNRAVHGVDDQTCAICGKQAVEGTRLNRDHAHFDGGYPRGLLCWYCNKKLGEVERGTDAVAWLVSAREYVLRSAEHRAGEVAA